MNVSDFDFELPADRIALRPVNPRDRARLLEVTPNSEPILADRCVRDLPDVLRPGDALVLNNTRVIPAALTGQRIRDGNVAKITVNLHKRVDRETWKAFVKPAKKLATGDRIIFGDGGNVCVLGSLDATVAEKGYGGEITLVFDLSGDDLERAIEASGVMPLPPYIAARRQPDRRDSEDYQTVFAQQEGAVAAPTAGLHFTDELFEALDAQQVSRHFVTLHVGAGTFLPVKSEAVEDHKMHCEWGEISAETAAALNEVRASGGRIVAVGTTSLRLLESAVSGGGEIEPFLGDTDIFITPGYRFKAVDLLLTNFHLPRSTLFMLVSAFSGLDVMKTAYAHAIEGGYRFYSYGDACLLHRADPQI